MNTLTFVLLLTLSFVLVTGAYRTRTSDALREQLLDYLFQDEDRNLADQARRTALRKQFQQYNGKFFNSDEYNDGDDQERTHVRRKLVGLGDNPFK